MDLVPEAAEPLGDLGIPLRGSNLHTPAMTAAGKHILDDFESLPDVEKREVLSNLLKILRGIDYPEMTDVEMVGATDEIFQAYDAAEQKA